MGIGETVPACPKCGKPATPVSGPRKADGSTYQTFRCFECWPAEEAPRRYAWLRYARPLPYVLLGVVGLLVWWLR